jgi:hypothetical protein
VIEPFRRSARPAVLGVVVSIGLMGCGDLPPPPPASPGTVARTAPDDSDAWSLVPASAASLVDVDLAALRASPWTRSLVAGGFVEDREERLRTFGYDVFNDVDRLVVAGLDIAGQAQQVVVVTGRLDPARVARAFAASTPGATETRWRDCRVWETPDRSVALVGRTLVHGSPETVRAAIDAAWGIVPGARGGPPGELARAVDAEARRPAILLAVVVTDEVRARAQGLVELPPTLRRLAARLDLGADLQLEAQAILEDAGGAKTAARQWSLGLRELRGNGMLRAMGLGPVVEGATLQAEGLRVHGRLRIAEDKREALSERFVVLLQALAAARGQGAAPAPP